MNSVEFKNVAVRSSGVTILEKINAVIPQGSNTAIVGPNGAGKTTLLNAVLKHISFEGYIEFNPEKPVFGFVPQRMSFDRTMPVTVLEFMLMGMQKTPLWAYKNNKLKSKALENLVYVGAENLIERMIGELSGGELQRVLLALALQQKPDILVLDEPSAGVDMGGEKLFCALLDQLRKQYGFTQLMVSHDLSMVAEHADHVICLNRTVIGSGEPCATLNTEVLTKTFGLHTGALDLFNTEDKKLKSHSPSCCHE